MKDTPERVGTEPALTIERHVGRGGVYFVGWLTDYPGVLVQEDSHAAARLALLAEWEAIREHVAAHPRPAPATHLHDQE